MSIFFATLHISSLFTHGFFKKAFYFDIICDLMKSGKYGPKTLYTPFTKNITYCPHFTLFALSFVTPAPFRLSGGIF